jgi:hypothetical protein
MSSSARPEAGAGGDHSLGQRRIADNMTRIVPGEVREAAGLHRRDPGFVDRPLLVVTPMVIP